MVYRKLELHDITTNFTWPLNVFLSLSTRGRDKRILRKLSVWNQEEQWNHLSAKTRE